jgi:nucleotide-binding universal stress UspA family protein
MSTPLLPAGAIVVGTDGSSDADRAVAWGARQAGREGRPLALVHSAPVQPLGESVWLDAHGVDHAALSTALEQAEYVDLERARDLALADAPGIDVTAHLVREDPRSALVEASEHAHQVVLGSRGRGMVRSALLGSVSVHVARHARCPVVVCRPTRGAGLRPGSVVVGADGTAASVQVLEFAFTQASFQHVPLVVMHCFWDAAVALYGPGTVGGREHRSRKPPDVPRDGPDTGRDTGRDTGTDDGPSDGLDDLRLLLAESVAGLREKYPDVEVTLELSRGLVDDCLAGHTPTAGLLVVGRPVPSGTDRFLHASCAVAVLERAHTVVAVVPER